MYRSGETQIGVVPLGEHAGYVFVLQPCASDYWDEEDTRFDRVREILSGFPGLNFVTKHMSKEHPVIFNKLEQVAVQEPWYKGRVVIGGDAAHAGAPTLAQGAAMAIEDGHGPRRRTRKPRRHQNRISCILRKKSAKSTQSAGSILRNRPPRAERRAGSGRADWGVLCVVGRRVLMRKKSRIDLDFFE